MSSQFRISLPDKSTVTCSALFFCIKSHRGRVKLWPTDHGTFPSSKKWKCQEKIKRNFSYKGWRMISSVRTLRNPKACTEFVNGHRELTFVEGQEENLQTAGFSKAVLRRDFRSSSSAWFIRPRTLTQVPASLSSKFLDSRRNTHITSGAQDKTSLPIVWALLRTCFHLFPSTDQFLNTHSQHVPTYRRLPHL